MKIRHFFLLSVFAVICCMAYGFCEEREKTHKEFNACDKIYLKPNQISIEPNGIFVNVFEQWFMADALYVDAEGVYFTKAVSDNWSLFWKCPQCGYINGPLDNKCQNKECPSRKKNKQ